MKKTISLLFCVLCLFSVCGCTSFFVDEEQEIYNETVKELLDALDRKDVITIYNLFSPAVQKEKTDLKENIEALVSLYHGPTEQIGDISSLAGGADYEYGDRCKNANTTFPVFSDGEYYWFYLDFMYENTFDENQIGITQLDFYTADAYYEFWSSEEKQKENKGLNIFIKEIADYNIISVNNYPYDFRLTQPLDMDAVKSFLETSVSLYAFTEQFGQAASENDMGRIYALPAVDGAKRYLYISCDED